MQIFSQFQDKKHGISFGRPMAEGLQSVVYSFLTQKTSQIGKVFQSFGAPLGAKNVFDSLPKGPLIEGQVNFWFTDVVEINKKFDLNDNHACNGELFRSDTMVSSQLTIEIWNAKLQHWQIMTLKMKSIPEL